MAVIPWNEEDMVLLSADLGQDRTKHGFNPVVRLPVKTDCFLLMSERFFIWNVNHGSSNSPWKYTIVDYLALMSKSSCAEDLPQRTVVADNFDFLPDYDEDLTEAFVKDLFWLSIRYEKDTSER